MKTVENPTRCKRYLERAIAIAEKNDVTDARELEHLMEKLIEEGVQVMHITSLVFTLSDMKRRKRDGL